MICSVCGGTEEHGWTFTNYMCLELESAETAPDVNRLEFLRFVWEDLELKPAPSGSVCDACYVEVSHVWSIWWADFWGTKEDIICQSGKSET